ncbi:glucose oxidase [Seiridium cupressi]
MIFLNIACLVGSALLVASFATRQSQDSYSDAHFDYVILGGGTAGMVIANRLSENPNNTVLVVEAGTFQYDNPIVKNTTVLGIATNTDVDWQYESVRQIYAANQTIEWSAGKGLGGSSLINGMTFIRPASSQIDLWPSLGLDLDWNTLFANGKKSERFTIPPPNIQALGGRYVAANHGFDGILDTCISQHMPSSDIHTVFNDTMKNLGIPPITDFDGGELRGFGCQPVTQDSVQDVREDAARAYYYPIQDRENLHVMVNTTATRIIWSQNNEDGEAVALAASVVRQNGQVSTIYADREVILSAGAIRSPAILEYSGVGNPSVLSKYNISTTINLPAVGENFQDQTVLGVTANFTSRIETGFPNFVSHTSLQDLFGDNTTSVYNTAIAQLPAYAEQIAAQNGGASSASVQQRLFKSQLDLLYNSNTPTSEVIPTALGNLAGVFFWPLQPLSRGNVHIVSENETTPPSINPNFFQSNFDGLAAVQTARFSRRVLTTAPLSDLIDLASLAPSFEEVPEDASDELWLNWIKNSAFGPNHHHLGSCAMLPRDMGGVVDNNFMVYGTSNVRVIDLSVIPLQVAGHSISLLYAVAEWAATKFT